MGIISGVMGHVCLGQWGLFLVLWDMPAFFLMIRKSNLVPNSAKTFQSQKQLIRENILNLIAKTMF
jgi:hypothetical protein